MKGTFSDEKKRIAILCISIAIALIASVSAYTIGHVFAAEATQASEVDPVIKKSMEEAAKYEEKPRLDIAGDEVIKEGDKRDLLDSDPPPIFSAHSNLKDYYDINQSIDKEYLASIGAKILLTEVIPYSTFVEKYDEGSLTAIDANRLVWVVQIYFPDGYETKVGLFKNATTTSLYDAETGFYFGYSIQGDEPR
jgi:hypothetical protein